MNHDRGTYAGWKAWRERGRKRRETLEAGAHVLAYHAFLLGLLAQVWRGSLAQYFWSETAVKIIIVIAGVSAIGLLVFPEQGVQAIKKATNTVGSFLLGKLTAAVLMVIYIVLLPLGYMYGRARFTKLHPGGAGWVQRGDWRRSTWGAKVSEAENDVKQHGTLRRLAWYFIERGNLIILVLVAILLVAVSLSILAHTPYLAPFVYTIF